MLYFLIFFVGYFGGGGCGKVFFCDLFSGVSNFC